MFYDGHAFSMFVMFRELGVYLDMDMLIEWQDRLHFESRYRRWVWKGFDPVRVGIMYRLGSPFSFENTLVPISSFSNHNGYKSRHTQYMGFATNESSFHE